VEDNMKRKVLVITGFCLVLSFVCGLVIADETKTNKKYKEYVMKVSGTGKLSVDPDSFTLVFAVDSESLSLRKATRKNSEKIASIMEEINKMQIPNLEFSTSTFDFSGNRSFFAGKKYRIRNRVTVKAEKIKYGELSDYASSVIDAAIQNGATESSGLTFYLENERITENKLLKLALSDAKEKAALMAKELGLTSNRPYNVLGFWVHGPGGPVRYEYDARVMKEAMASARVVSGKKVYTAQVDLEYKFE
jgi:uncharacterized protein YggE